MYVLCLQVRLQRHHRLHLPVARLHAAARSAGPAGSWVVPPVQGHRLPAPTHPLRPPAAAGRDRNGSGPCRPQSSPGPEHPTPRRILLLLLRLVQVHALITKPSLPTPRILLLRPLDSIFFRVYSHHSVQRVQQHWYISMKRRCSCSRRLSMEMKWW